MPAPFDIAPMPLAASTTVRSVGNEAGVGWFLGHVERVLQAALDD
jgi:hypothetical protein